MSCRFAIFLVFGGLFAGPLEAENSHLTPPTHPEPWQVAGIRAAFGDERSPDAEPSPAVQREALKLCAAHGWGEALDSREVAVFLASKDVGLRHFAAIALSQAGEAGGLFARELAMSVDPAERYGISAADYLSVLGPRAVIGLLSDPNPRMRRDALGAASQLTIGSGQERKLLPGVAEAAARLLEDKDASVRMAAALTLCDMGQDGRAFAARIAAFFSGLAVDERGELALKLAALPGGIESVAADFAPMFESRSVEVRCQAAKACQRMGANGVRFGPNLASLLEDADSEVRVAALDAFAKIGPTASSFATQVAANLKDSIDDVRIAAEFALGNLGPEGAKFAAEVGELLKAPNEAERFCAICSLSGMGEAAVRFSPEIAKLLPTKDFQTQKQISIAFIKMGEEGAAHARQVALMWKGVGFPEPFPLGHPSKEFLQKTVGLLDDERAEVRAAAAHLLGKFSTDAEPCVGLLITQFSDSDRDARAAAIRALPFIRPNAAEFAPKFAALLDDKEFVVRAAAVWALGRVAPSTAEWNETIARALGDPNIGPQASSIDALTRNGRAAHHAQEITAMLKAPSPYETAAGLHRLAIQALDTLKDLDPSLLNAAVPSLLDKNYDTASAAFRFFDHRGNDQGDLDLQAALLATASAIPGPERAMFRAHLRLWAGGNSEMQRSVTWLGKPDLEPMPKEGLSPAEMPAVLEMLRDLWDHSSGQDSLREEIVGRIVKIAKATSAKPDAETMKILEELRDKMEDEGIAAKAVEAVRGVIGK